MKKYKITKEQVLKYNMKEEFPEVFEVKLEVGKWYKSNYPLLIFIEQIHHSYLVGYGFNSTQEFKTGNFCRRLDDKHKVDYKNFNFIEATEQEVFEALKNEAVKRGFKEDVYILSPKNKHNYKIIENIFYYGLENNILSIGGYNIFNNGIWAEILETISKKEAEEKLNCKII